MKFFSRGFLLDLLLISFILIKPVFTNLDRLTILAIIFVIYAIISIITYLYKPERSDGESRLGYLIFGCIYLVGGIIFFAFTQVLNAYATYIIGSIFILHSISRICIKNNRGLAIKIIQIIWGISLIAYAIYCMGFIPSIEIINKIINYKYILIIILVIDLLILILSCALPRNDLENKDVKIDYSSDEDQIVYKKDHSSHEIEVIDLDRLFNRKKGENNNEKM